MLINGNLEKRLRDVELAVRRLLEMSRPDQYPGNEEELEKAYPSWSGDPDARIMRIFDIINSSLNLREDDDVLVRDLKRGIRKAMNEFYRGPVASNDMQARLTALQTKYDDLLRKADAMEDLIKKLAPVADYGIGDRVRKVSGYTFPGEVRGVVTTKKGDVRYIVEATGDNDGNYAGMLHIYSANQLTDADD